MEKVINKPTQVKKSLKAFITYNIYEEAIQLVAHS